MRVHHFLMKSMRPISPAVQNGSKLHVRSITVTGHSLGGALASLCGFDLATAVAEAVKADGKPLDTSGGVVSVFLWVTRGGGGGLPQAGHTQRNQANPTAGGPEAKPHP
jgi:hypothetical protein